MDLGKANNRGLLKMHFSSFILIIRLLIRLLKGLTKNKRPRIQHPAQCIIYAGWLSQFWLNEWMNQWVTKICVTPQHVLYLQTPGEVTSSLCCPLGSLPLSFVVRWRSTSSPVLPQMAKRRGPMFPAAATSSLNLFNLTSFIPWRGWRANFQWLPLPILWST